MTQSSHGAGFIITTSQQSRTQYGVTQAPLGLTSTIRGSCVARGSFAGNTPIDDNTQFDCSGVPPTPPPPPGNDNYYFYQGSVRYEYAPTPKCDFGSFIVRLNQGSVRYEYAPTPHITFG